MTRQEAEHAVKEYVEQEIREGDELLDATRIEFTEEDERCFFFSSGDCEIGVFKDSGIVAIVPSEGGLT